MSTPQTDSGSENVADASQSRRSILPAVLRCANAVVLTLLGLGWYAGLFTPSDPADLEMTEQELLGEAHTRARQLVIKTLNVRTKCNFSPKPGISIESWEPDVRILIKDDISYLDPRGADGTKFSARWEAQFSTNRQGSDWKCDWLEIGNEVVIGHPHSYP